MPLHARSSRYGSCRAASYEELLRLLPELGWVKPPLHLLVGRASLVRALPRVACHQAGRIPDRSFVRMAPDVLIASPELCLVQVARELGNLPRRKRIVATACCGFELAGTFRKGLEDPFGLTMLRQPSTTVERMRAYCFDQVRGMHGAKTARRALDLVLDNARSPGEVSMALLLCAPRWAGGIGLPGPRLNHPIQTAAGTRYIDLAFPEHRLGLEYKGRAFHGESRAQADDRRENKLAGNGYTILNVWHEDLARPGLFDELVRDIGHVMGKRIRLRSRSFLERQQGLRLMALPPVRRFG